MTQNDDAKSVGAAVIAGFSKAIALVSAAISWCMLSLIRVYRLFLSPWIGNQCRFHPSCSRYAEQAIIEHGPVRGAFLTLRRLGRCHPWHPGGCDPVPPSRS